MISDNYKQNPLETIALVLTALSILVTFIWFIIKKFCKLVRFLFFKSELEPSPTLTITPLSVQYYEKTYETTIEEENKYVVTYPHVYTPWNPAIHSKEQNEYIFIKLDIHNQTTKRIELTDYFVEILNPQTRTMTVGKGYFVKTELPYSFNEVEIWNFPIIIDKEDNRYGWLCLKIQEFPERVENARTLLELTEGDYIDDRTYETIINLYRNDDFVKLERLTEIA